MKFVVCLVFTAGCFDSLINNPCDNGYTLSRGACVSTVDGGGGGNGPDGGGGSLDGGSVGDATMADALVCMAPQTACSGMCVDETSDPNNCGSCGRVCASGICENSNCLAGNVGHIVAIGHDFRSSHPGMARLLANAIGLGLTPSLRVGFYVGGANAAAATGTITAARSGLAALGRPHTDIGLNAISQSTLATLDSVVIDAQTGDGNTLQALGATWLTPLANFLDRGGVVVMLEGVGGTSYRAAQGANLYTVPAPADATNQRVDVVNVTDAVTQGVPTPYLAETTSVSFPGVVGVVANSGGDAVVIHTTR